MHCTSRTLLTGVFKLTGVRSSTLPPTFLIPSLTSTPTASFSSSASPQARKDGNPSRGVSALRRTGLGRRQKLSVKPEDLPLPVLDPRERSTIEVDEGHGLWEFFGPERNSLYTPQELEAHGRAWSVPELRRKDWDDLWRLWWVCAKEKNRVATFLEERKRVGNLIGDEEAGKRMRELKLTQKAIKHVLTERWYAWENARYAAMEDPSVNLHADPEQGEQAYTRKQRAKRVVKDYPSIAPDIAPPPPNEVKIDSGVRV